MESELERFMSTVMINSMLLHRLEDLNQVESEENLEKLP